MSVLRALVRRCLGAIGLAPASHVAGLRQQAESDRAAAAKAREDALTWKSRAEALGDTARRADELAQRLAKAERQAERADLYLTELRDARARIERAEQALALTREHLMSTETKLDLVEAAIGVLDLRTRE